MPESAYTDVREQMKVVHADLPQVTQLVDVGNYLSKRSVSR